MTCITPRAARIEEAYAHQSDPIRRLGLLHEGAKTFCVPTPLRSGGQERDCAGHQLCLDAVERFDQGSRGFASRLHDGKRFWGHMNHRGHPSELNRAPGQVFVILDGDRVVVDLIDNRGKVSLDG